MAVHTYWPYKYLPMVLMQLCTGGAASADTTVRLWRMRSAEGEAAQSAAVYGAEEVAVLEVIAAPQHTRS